ncbi:MAG: ABC-F family ATP-binding cassette domain-containing protein [Anaerolineae bacterium]|jgi:ATP-binding cassette subfamily F protein 3|nr:ABC-F family ATP-binding cassette domain-containing protein [Anaerolineae bacterium]
MSLLTTYNLAKSYGADDIFDEITVEIPQKARIALVGPNGAGKTTLLNLLLGLDLPTEGTISIAKGTRIGFLPQRPELRGAHTVWEEQLQALGDLRRMEAELERLEQQLNEDPNALTAYGDLQEQFEAAGGYTYEHRIRMILQGVGFKPDQYDLPLAKLSGGQKTRTLLARLLIEAPDLLILDEPTNHLDIDAIEWLEGYLREFPGAVLAVSHDRYFMDTFANTIWELEYGEITVYRGNYTHYLQQRQERHERLMKEFEAQQEFLAKEEDYIRRNIAGQNTRQAKGRLKKLETMKKRGKVIHRPRGKRREMSLKIKAALRSGDKVLMTEHLTVGYADKPVLTVPDITLYRGETVGLIGPNGVGKSTFLKTITAQLGPLNGAVRLGASVQIGYFAQAHESLDPHKTLIDEIYAIKPMAQGEIRNYLSGFLFTGDDVFRPVETLSGGERGRLALAKLALTGANLLLLDEPTNHLDIDSQEVLQSVIADFEGTVILVTHDRYLVDALATQIWAARSGAMQVFEGSYQEFLADRERQRQTETEMTRPKDKRGKPAETKIPKKHGLNPFQLQRRIHEVEGEIERLEEQIRTLTDAITHASTAGDALRVRDLAADLAQAEDELHGTMSEWELLME